MIIVLYDILENLFPFNFYILFLVSFPPQLRRNELDEADFQKKWRNYFKSVKIYVPFFSSYR